MPRTAAAATGTKSDRFRRILRENPDATVATAASKIGIGYAFAYGIAARTPDPANPGKSFAQTRANRRAERAVRIEPGAVFVRIADGSTVRVDTETGKSTRTR